MSSATISRPTLEAAYAQRKRALFVVGVCTLICAAAQVLIKSGANHLPHARLAEAILGIVTNPLLFLGYSLYGVFTLALVYALRHGELSIMYPIISLSYVWVAVLSVVIFHEQMNFMKACGIVTIVCGVAVLGRGGSKV